MEHTKLPWEVKHEGNWGWCIKAEKYYIAFKLTKLHADTIVFEHNSHDELLAACKELRDVLNHDCGYSAENHLIKCIAPATLKANTAISKAEGK